MAGKLSHHKESWKWGDLSRSIINHHLMIANLKVAEFNFQAKYTVSKYTGKT